jgi:hypothetical protein
MAKEQVTEQEATSQEEETQNGSNGRKTALRAAAIAAASGATAIAAKKAFSGRQGSQPGGGGSTADESLFSTMLTSGWDSARDSLLPFAEEAATGAGEFVARHAPEVVRDTLVPRFISGFESARKKASEDE